MSFLPDIHVHWAENVITDVLVIYVRRKCRKMVLHVCADAWGYDSCSWPIFFLATEPLHVNNCYILFYLWITVIEYAEKLCFSNDKLTDV